MNAIAYVAEVDARVGGARGWCGLEQIRRPKPLRQKDIEARQRQLAEPSKDVLTVDSLIDSNKQKIRFHHPLNIELRMDAQQEWHCHVPVFSVEGHGATREEAQADAANIIRQETGRYLHTMSHTLDDQELDRKGTFLGNVDVVTSGISKPLGEFVWVAGVVEIDANGKATFRQDRTDGDIYELAADVLVPNDSFVRMGKLRRDAAGFPISPVVELEEPLSDDAEATFAEWERLTTRVD